MNAATAILEHVQSVAKVSREALIAEIERTHDPKVVSPTVSTMIGRGELKELANGDIVLGSEDEIEKARQEREQRKKDRDRPTMPPASPTPHPAAGAEPTKPRTLDRRTFVAPKPGSVAHSNAIAHQMIAAVLNHGPLTAKQIQKHVPELKDGTLHYKCQTLVDKSQLLKRGLLYAVTSDQFDKAPAAPAPNAEAIQPLPPKRQRVRSIGDEVGTSAAPIVDVIAAAAQAEELSRLEPPVVPEAEPKQPEETALQRRLKRDKEAGQEHSRIKSIADVARKHAVSAPEEHVLQIGDIYIAVTAPATVATRVLSAALAVLGGPA